MGNFNMVFVLLLAYWGWVHSEALDVLDYGAVGDGKIDDSKAFLKAWTVACSAGTGPMQVDVPSGKRFMVGPLDFKGPCKSTIDFRVEGDIVAPGSRNAWNEGNQGFWISFIKVNGLNILGSGQINGQGPMWWGCNEDCLERPTAFAIRGCNNVKLSGLKFVNSGAMHVMIISSTYVQVSSLTITAPQDSPTTDGINIQQVQHAKVQDCIVGTGDDCISIGTGTSDVNISGITCGPGHGISIGSLGKDGSKAEVEGIRVSNAHFIETMNGVRIKSWQGGSGYARHIVFENLNFTRASNPIIIDQYYCPFGSCPNQTSAVQVSDVKYIGAIGSSMSEVAINLACSKSVGCTNIYLENVDIKLMDPHKQAYTYCIAAHGSAIGRVNPQVPCFVKDKMFNTSMTDR